MKRIYYILSICVLMCFFKATASQYAIENVATAGMSVAQLGTFLGVDVHHYMLGYKALGGSYYSWLMLNSSSQDNCCACYFYNHADLGEYTDFRSINEWYPQCGGCANDSSTCINVPVDSSGGSSGSKGVGSSDWFLCGLLCAGLFAWGCFYHKS
jgi:hypothetical protein